MELRLLTVDDIDAYLAHCVAHNGESGHDGDPHFGPYSRDEDYPVEEVRQRTLTRWAMALMLPSWRRAWGVFDYGVIVGCGNLAAGDLPADLHRVDLGMSILRPYRRQGWGRRLLEAIIIWCRAQPTIDWIDLGVFSNNPPARALYQDLGFIELGCTPDRWRVDGIKLDEIPMTLAVCGNP